MVDAWLVDRRQVAARIDHLLMLSHDHYAQCRAAVVDTETTAI